MKDKTKSTICELDTSIYKINTFLLETPLSSLILILIQGSSFDLTLSLKS